MERIIKKILLHYFAAKSMSQVFPNAANIKDSLTNEEIDKMQNACARICYRRAKAMIEEGFKNTLTK